MLDCGLFHVLDDGERERTSAARLKWSVGVVFITCSALATYPHRFMDSTSPGRTVRRFSDAAVLILGADDR